METEGENCPKRRFMVEVSEMVRPDVSDVTTWDVPFLEMDAGQDVISMV